MDPSPRQRWTTNSSSTSRRRTPSRQESSNSASSTPINTPDSQQNRPLISLFDGESSTPNITTPPPVQPSRSISADAVLPTMTMPYDYSSPIPLSSAGLKHKDSNTNLPLSRTFTADLDQHILRGLTLAGVVVCCLDTLYSLFHVDVFLRAYKLPKTTYSLGRILFSVWSTGSTLWASGWLDSQVATTGLDRCALVGCLGVVLAIAFVLPFGRFWGSSSSAIDSNIVGMDSEHPEEGEDSSTAMMTFFWQAVDGAHFVVSMTLYDTMSTVMSISLASAISDDHNMTDQERVQNMSSSQVYNLLASVTVATIGLNLFDVTALRQFQIFVAVLAVLSIMIFGTAQSVISGDYLQLGTRNRKHTKFWHIWKGWTVAVPREIRRVRFSQTARQTTTSAIVWRQALRDLWNHSNFMRWIILEMLLEMQTHFVQTFFKTFVDQLLVDVPHVISDWSLSLLRPLQQITTIAIWLPIQWYGYPRVYTVVITTLWLLSSLTLCGATPASTSWILCFLVVYGVGSEAMRAAGFYLVMSDLVLELKQTHAQQGRLNEPSLAGLLLGAATLVCKPMQSLLPVLAATLLNTYPEQPQKVLYYLLVLPPWICSLLQLWVWRNYDLHPKRTYEIRVELQEFHFYQNQQKEQQQHAKSSSQDLALLQQEHNELVPSQSNEDKGYYSSKRRVGQQLKAGII